MRRCINTEASHYERHLTVAKLINDLNSSNNVQQDTPIRGRKKGRKQENNSDLAAQDEITTTDISSTDPDSLSEDLDFRNRSEERFTSSSERKSLKRTMKDKRSQEKAFRNQQKFVVSVSQAHVDRVAKVIHGAQYNVDRIGGHSGTQDKEIDSIFQRNDVYNAGVQAHRTWLKDQVRESRARKGKHGPDAQKKQYKEDVESRLLVEKQDSEELVSSILVQFGFHAGGGGGDLRSTKASSVNPPTPTRGRKNAGLLQQLRQEIAADIEKSENERRATQQRMEGYWRYVNGTVTNRLANNAQSVDRATGVKLKGDDARLKLEKELQIERAEGLEAEAEAHRCEG